jgi:predicted regulator of Ras-like GTPase activity (Roadblock/LC7/MglB family)
MDTRYAVIDIQDGKIVAIRKTRRAALILADKKDQAYGMYRYQVKRIENV